MARRADFKTQLSYVVRPTAGQVLLAFLVAVVLLAYGFNVQITTALGITSEAITSVLGAIAVVLQPILRSSVTENAVLIGFWSSVGLAAYLVSWIFYSLGVAARNEVTIATRYANQGRWHGPWATLGLKAMCSLLLLIVLVSLAPGINLWLEVGLPAFNGVSIGGIIGLIVSVIGLAVQLYLVLAAVQLTFLPWYRAEAFTNELR